MWLGGEGGGGLNDCTLLVLAFILSVLKQ